MVWIYTIGIALFTFIAKIASLFNKKAKLFTEGRINLFQRIAQQTQFKESPIWFHFASLGEFEQGRPVLEKIKEISPNSKIVITFFSPSGYEIRKNYSGSDAIFYLPMDTPSNAKRFIELVNPKMAIFTKYDFWYHYFNQLHQKNIPLYLISGIFRPQQAFFKWYGTLNRKMLQCINHFFVQNAESANLLKSIDLQNVTVTGDTRFDRVYENSLQVKNLPLIKQFCQEKPVLILGSSWPADEKLFTNFLNLYPDWKIIIAPHEVHENHIQEIEKLFPAAVRYSTLIDTPQGHNESVLIINNIGLLSSLYQYGKIAFIGGGFGAGIHNTLEAAAFGLPVIFGPKYQKFQEAKDLLNIGAAKSIENEEQLLSAFAELLSNPKASQQAKIFVEQNKGATALIMQKIVERL